MEHDEAQQQQQQQQDKDSGGPSPFTVVASVLKASAEGILVDMGELRAIGHDHGHAVEMHVPMDGVDCVVLDGVLSAEECAYLVQKTEDMGYSFWDSRPEKNTEFRNADTIEMMSEDLAKLLWERIEAVMKDSVVIEKGDELSQRWQRDIEGTWDPVGTNPTLLFARYRQGGHFAPHTDGYSIVDCDERSMYSIVLFLNTCTEGGGTRFYKEEQKEKLAKDEMGRYTGQEEYVLTTVEPVVGRMVLFFHNILHQGVGVGMDAEKYIIRSDVMYRRRDPVCKTEQDKKAFEMYQEAQEMSTAGNIDEAMLLFRKAFKLSPTLADLYGM